MGALMMFMTTLSWTTLHLFTKIILSRNPKLTGFDTVAFMATSLVVFYSIKATITGTSLNVFQYKGTAILLVFLRVLLGNLNYAFVFCSLKYISISKGVLIYS